MSDIHIHRVHTLGLAQAREVARQWALKAEQKFDMRCAWGEGDAADTLTFKRQGVSGQVTVGAHHFDLVAQLGFLLSAFSKTIEAEIEKNLDELLAGPVVPSSGGIEPAKTPDRR